MGIEAAIIGGVALSAVGAGVSSALAPDAPKSPNFAAATREGIEADMDTLARRKLIEAQAKLGGTVLKEGYSKKSVQAGSEGAAAERAKLEARLSASKSALDALKADGAGLVRKPGSKGGVGSMVPDPDYDSKLSSAQAAYDAANSALLNFQDVTSGEGDVDLYYDASGNIVTADEAVDADFSGISDVDQAKALWEAQMEMAPEYAQKMLDIQQQFGASFIEQRLKELEMSDPEGFAIRKQMGQQILAEGFGTDLTDAERTNVQQAARSAQSSRGNLFGAAPAAVEAMQVGDAGYRRQQQRLANAAAFMSGTTPVAQFGQISGAQGGAAPVGSFTFNQGIGLNPMAGQMGQQAAMQSYGIQSNNWQFGVQNDPWQTLLGSVAGMGTTVAGGLAYNKLTGGGSLFGGG